MRLKNLNHEATSALKKDKISYGQARVLVNLEPSKQNEYLDLIINGKYSVHDIENLAKREKRPRSYIKDIESFEEKNKVKINIGRKTLSFKFKKITDLKKFLNEHFKNFENNDE